MFEFLVHIPGKTYLAIYAAVALAAIAIGWYTTLDSSSGFREPAPTKFDAISIACLIGLPHVIRTVIFGLWSRNMVRFEGDDKNPTLIATVGTEQGRNRIEKRLLEFLKQSHNPLVLFSNPNLRKELNEDLEPNRQALVRAHLLLAPEEKKRLVKTAWMTFFILLAAMLAKLIWGVSRSKPVGFLILEFVAGLTLMLVVLRPWKIATRLGKRYLKTLKKHFEWVRQELDGGKIPNGMDPSLALAVFGAGMFSKNPAFDAFNRTFHRSSTSDSSGCGGCGYGSDGGSDGGGGCGGCGGCGG